MRAIHEICSVCGKKFDVVFRYQMEERDGGFAFYCSQICLQRSHGSPRDGTGPMVTCDGCAKRFSLTLASQVLYASGRRRYACSMPCRHQLQREAGGARLEEFVHPGAGPDGECDSLEAVASTIVLPTAAAVSVRNATPEAAPEADRTPSLDRAAPADEASVSLDEGDDGADDEPAAATAATAETARVEAVAARASASTTEKHSSPAAARKPTAPVAAKPGVVGRGALRAAVTGARNDTGKLSELHTPIWQPRRIAVFNHKGGTGKTTTSVSLAAGLASRGKRVLLVDTDSQGNVAVSLGVSGDRSLYHVLVMGLRAQDVTRTIRPNFDVLPSNETLAAAELYLAGRQQRDRVLAARLQAAVDSYDYVIIDCSPSLSLMNQNALVLADSVLVPVACDYLSLVGVRQVIKTVRNVNTLLHHKLQIWGVLPTFFDMRAKICNEALDTLRNHFGERCLEPIRATTRLKEAPAQAQSIFEYAPGTRGAEDYCTLVDRLLGGEGRMGCTPPTVTARGAAQPVAASMGG